MYNERIAKVRTLMTDKDIDVFFLGPSSDMFYMTGYGVKADKRLLLLVLPKTTGKAFIIANLLYKEQINSIAAAPLIDDFVFWKDGEDPFALLKSEVEKRGIPLKRAALEASIPALFTLPLSRSFPGTDFVLGSTLTEPLRQYKDEAELEIIRRACAASDHALAAMFGEAAGASNASASGDAAAAHNAASSRSAARWLGKSEAEFYAALQAEFSSRGLTQFGAGIAVGANAAVPHHVPGAAKI